MAAPAITVHLYRRENPDGTSKDWDVPTVLDPQRLTVYFGRTGSTLRQAETPAAECRDGIPIREAEKRIREKLAKGYQTLGTFRLAANRRDLTPVSPPDGDAPETPEAALYWRWRPTGGVETARRRARDTACTEIIAGLAAVGWTLPGCSPDERDGLLIWSALSQDIHQGVVTLTDDRKPLIAFFLLLARRRVGLSLVDESGQGVTEWPAELPVEAAILETLGLRPKDLNQLLTGSGGDTWFF